MDEIIYIKKKKEERNYLINIIDKNIYRVKTSNSNIDT